MVSNASEDFPDPEGPVKMVIFPLGIDVEMFLRVFWWQLVIVMASIAF